MSEQKNKEQDDLSARCSLVPDQIRPLRRYFAAVSHQVTFEPFPSIPVPPSSL
jgi:hypothetical protein